jgi:tRNA(Ile)-lysidine synthase TilS/MesJ
LQKQYKSKTETSQAKFKMANVVVSLSGGKDSVYALYTALKEGLNLLTFKKPSKSLAQTCWFQA